MYIIVTPEDGRRVENTRFSSVAAAVKRIKHQAGKWSDLQPQNELDLAAVINQKTGVIMTVRRET